MYFKTLKVITIGIVGGLGLSYLPMCVQPAIRVFAAFISGGF